MCVRIVLFFLHYKCDKCPTLHNDTTYWDFSVQMLGYLFSYNIHSQQTPHAFPPPPPSLASNSLLVLNLQAYM